MARLYGQIRDAYSWPNPVIDELTTADADELMEHWLEQPPLSVVVRRYLGYREEPADDEPARLETREVTQEQFDRIVAEHKAQAARHGVRNPFA